MCFCAGAPVASASGARCAHRISGAHATTGAPAGHAVQQIPAVPRGGGRGPGVRRGRRRPASLSTERRACVPRDDPYAAGERALSGSRLHQVHHRVLARVHRRVPPHQRRFAPELMPNNVIYEYMYSVVVHQTSITNS